MVEDDMVRPEDVDIAVAFLRTSKVKLEEKYKERLNKAVAEANAKFPKFSPMIEEMVKTCKEENAAALAIVLSKEIQYGISSEETMEERLKIAKMIFDRWVEISKVAGKATDSD